MLKIIHRVNKIEELRKIPVKYGVEVDIRTHNNKLILNHEPFENGDLLEEYLGEFNHAFIILEIKEEGIEEKVLKLCEKFRIENYFLLSVTVPFLYMLSEKGIRKMAVRFSEFESINTVLNFKDKVDWVWIDTFTKNPLAKEIYEQLKGLKICFVCPDRWGRKEDIQRYKNNFEEEDIKLDAVMTSVVELWEER